MKITDVKVKEPATTLGAEVRCPECGWNNQFAVETGGKTVGDAEVTCHSCGAVLAFHWEKADVRAIP